MDPLQAAMELSEIRMSLWEQIIRHEVWPLLGLMVIVILGPHLGLIVRIARSMRKDGRRVILGLALGGMGSPAGWLRGHRTSIQCLSGAAEECLVMAWRRVAPAATPGVAVLPPADARSVVEVVVSYNDAGAHEGLEFIREVRERGLYGGGAVALLERPLVPHDASARGDDRGAWASGA